MYHNVSIHTKRYKLVNPSGFGNEVMTDEPVWELYDPSADPGEENNLVAEQPEQVELLMKRYEDWFRDVSSTRADNYAPPRIIVGSSHERVTVLTRQDWRHLKGRPWAPDSNGVWKIHAEADGAHRVSVLLKTVQADASSVELRWGEASWTKPVPEGVSEISFDVDGISAGPADLMAIVRDKGGADFGPWHVHVERR